MAESDSPQTPPAEKPQRFQFSLSCAIVAMILAGLVLGGVISLYLGIRTSVQAEFTLHANIEMLEVVEEYVKAHPGKWPRSWEDLLSTPSPRGRGWPVTIQDIKKRVHIDFDARLEDLAQQKPETFTGIKPIGPYYPVEGYNAGLLEAIRESLKAAAEKH